MAAISSPSSRGRIGLLLGFVGMAIFGGTLPATRIAVSAIDPPRSSNLNPAVQAGPPPGGADDVRGWTAAAATLTASVSAATHRPQPA